MSIRMHILFLSMNVPYAQMKSLLVYVNESILPIKVR